MSDEKKDSLQHINIKVVAPDQSEVFFKIKRTTPLSKLMNAYCERQGKQRSSVRFMFDGARVEDHATPEQLEMEDGDAIDVMVEQVGGFWAVN
ncbi:SUMO protein smt3 [Polyrhizophydium stewartii]|uniref:SUMO protein smt3 n=1 Tax=Polyrhizophydium stewartii TaxID=2732419 RepID=A0ABR4NH47_9FUNG